MITTSGFSSWMVAASAQVLKRKLTPRARHWVMRHSTMLIISRRRSDCAVSRTWPPAWLAASNTTTSWPRSAATRAASSPATPAPTITILRLPGALGMSWGMLVSRPVAGLWMQ
ncbi:hypothetical protein D3C87_1866860 [compost metagenome]